MLIYVDRKFGDFDCQKKRNLHALVKYFIVAVLNFLDQMQNIVKPLIKDNLHNLFFIAPTIFSSTCLPSLISKGGSTAICMTVCATS